MLKSATPVVVLLVSWFFQTEKPSLDVFLNITFITIGIALASVCGAQSAAMVDRI